MEALVSVSSEIVILDNKTTGNLNNISEVFGAKNIKVVRGDIRDSKLVDEVMRDKGTCFHLAASLGVKRILSNPITSYETNIHGTENIIKSATVNQTRVFLASTSEIYGKNPIQPLNENSDRVLGSPLNIRWSYAEAKALDESLVQIYHQENGLDYFVGRFFNTVGPRQTGNYGMVLPRFVTSALKNEELKVYGDGTQTRVFCHVKDAIQAVVALSNRDDTSGEVFNIGGEGEISIRSLAEKVIELSKSRSSIKHIPYSEAYPAGFEETFRRVPDTSKLRKAIGWQPQYTLDDIILDVINYFHQTN